MFLFFKLIVVNVYVFCDEDGWMVVDIGIDMWCGWVIWQVLLDGLMVGVLVIWLIVMYYYIDYMGFVGWFVVQGVQFWILCIVWLMVCMLMLDVQDCLMLQVVVFWCDVGMLFDLIVEWLWECFFNMFDVSMLLFFGYLCLYEGQMVSFGNCCWVVCMGEGYVLEYVMLWFFDDYLVIGGDQFLVLILFNLGVYLNELGVDIVGVWLDSCCVFLSYVYVDQFVLFGYKLLFNGLFMWLWQLIDNQMVVNDWLVVGFVVWFCMVVDCFELLYWCIIGKFELGLVLVEVMGYVNYLQVIGWVWFMGCNGDGVIFWGV